MGEICNACVLLVKRWKKLPKNTKRDWSHVVDARAGPGTKSFVKQKKKDDNSEEFEKIRRKHFLKKISRTEIEDDESERRSVSPLDTSSQPTESLSDVSSARLQDNTINDFFDSYYWKRFEHTFIKNLNNRQTRKFTLQTFIFQRDSLLWSDLQRYDGGGDGRYQSLLQMC